MSEQKPAIVLFKTFGRVIPALVLSSRIEPSHLGLNDEPLLTIAFMDPARETGLKKDASGEFVYPFGREPQIFIERDVVHESHEFDEEFLKQHGRSEAQVAAQRGNGEWSEFVDDETSGLVERLKQNFADVAKQRNDAQIEAASQKSRADLAEQVSDSLRKELEALKAERQQGNDADAKTEPPAAAE